MSGGPPSPPTEPLLEIRNLTIRYREADRQITAVRDVSFALKPGGSLAIVGESGSGKSSLAGAVLDFLGPEADVNGAILFEGQDIAGLSPAQRRRMLGRRIGAVFQDPFTALNPALRIGRQIAEPMVQHLGLPWSHCHCEQIAGTLYRLAHCLQSPSKSLVEWAASKRHPTRRL